MWFVYILSCSDDTFYTGVTTNIDRRLRQHNWEIVWWAKYTRVRKPVQVIYRAEFESRSEACIEESRIKKLTRKQKEELIKKDS
jgi:putative endonuclease